MAEKFVLHVGFHKTGTTAIQTSMYEARTELAKANITYLYARARAHHQAAWSLSQRMWGWKDRGGTKTSPKHWQKFAKQVNRLPGTAVASSEFFSEIGPAEIQKIRNDIKVADVQIVFTLRPLVKMLASSYQQYLKYGVKATYEEWLHAQLDEPGKTKMTPSFWQRNFHGDSIANWAKVFGAQNITVMVVDETEPDLLYTEFNKFLSLPAGFLKPAETGGNRSLNVEEIEFLQAVNKQFPKDRDWSDYTMFIRESAIKALTDSKMPEGSKKLLTPGWAQEIAKNLTEQSVQKIRESQVKVIGDLDTLAMASVPEGLDVPSGSMSINTAVQALLSIDQGVIRKFRWRKLVIEVVRRLKQRVGINAQESKNVEK
jgi:hypothetical protein